MWDWLLTMIDPPLRFFGAAVLPFAFVWLDISSIDRFDGRFAVEAVDCRLNTLVRRVLGVIGEVRKGELALCTDDTLGDTSVGTEVDKDATLGDT